MKRVLTSELIKLRRPGVLLGAGAVLPLLSVVATLAVVLTATDTAPTDGPGTTLGALSQAGGLTAGFTAIAAFLGLLVFALFASAFGSEYTSGTLRSMLTREPRRLRLLGGKWLALALFTASTLLLALVASALTALAVAPSQGLQTGEWFSGTGLSAAAGDYRNAVLSALLYGTLGAVVATLARSGIIAVGAGVAWLGPAEHLLADAVSGGNRWFPGLLFEATAQGGTAASSLTRSLLIGGLVAAAAAAIASVTFLRRDVST